MSIFCDLSKALDVLNNEILLIKRGNIMVYVVLRKIGSKATLLIELNLWK